MYVGPFCVLRGGLPPTKSKSGDSVSGNGTVTTKKWSPGTMMYHIFFGYKLVSKIHLTIFIFPRNPNIVPNFNQVIHQLSYGAAANVNPWNSHFFPWRVSSSSRRCVSQQPERSEGTGQDHSKGKSLGAWTAP